MIVVDASLVFDLVAVTRPSNELMDRLVSNASLLVAPELVELEVLQALRRQLRTGQIDTERCAKAREIFANLEIVRFPMKPLGERIWQLRDNLTAYDAAYFALAELYGVPLWTADTKYAGVPGHSVDLVLV